MRTLFKAVGMDEIRVRGERDGERRSRPPAQAFGHVKTRGGGGDQEGSAAAAQQLHSHQCLSSPEAWPRWPQLLGAPGSGMRPCLHAGRHTSDRHSTGWEYTAEMGPAGGVGRRVCGLRSPKLGSTQVYTRGHGPQADGRKNTMAGNPSGLGFLPRDLPSPLEPSFTLPGPPRPGLPPECHRPRPCATEPCAFFISIPIPGPGAAPP